MDVAGVDCVKTHPDGKHREIGERADLGQRASDAAAPGGLDFDAVARHRGHLVAESFADIGGTGP